MYDYFDLSKISVIWFSEWKYNENTILLEIFAMIEQNHPIRDEEKNLHFLAFSNFLFVMSWSSIIIPPWKITNSRISCCYYSHYTIYFSQIFKIYYIDGFTSNSSQLKLGWNLGKRQRLWVSLLLFKTCTVYTVSK